MDNSNNGHSDRVGALWINEGKKGKYLAGEIEVDGKKIPIIVFKNTRKEKENHPDYNILLRKPKEDAGGSYRDPDPDDVPF